MIVLICVIITISYLFLIGNFVYGFNKIEELYLTEEISKTAFSVIIPFRNEAENLPELLKSVGALDYPKDLFEIIFIDDASEDNSVELIQEYFKTDSYSKRSFDKLRMTSSSDIMIINNEHKTNSPKKDAITKAISIAKYEWIITTDADCVLPKNWLQGFDTYIQKHPKVKSLVAPVTYNTTNNFTERFQLIEMLCLQGVTIGGFGIKQPFLCNGANFAYLKRVFKELKGFDGNSNLASGDDIFLLEKIIKAYPKQIQYLKSQHAIVYTKAQTNWSQLISQRVRWASKTSAYSILFGKLTGLIVLLCNSILIIILVLSILGLFNIKSFGYLLVMKFSIDFLLLFKTVEFFNQKHILKSYFVSFFIYPFFSTYIGFISMFKSYKWKGRAFKK